MMMMMMMMLMMMMMMEGGREGRRLTGDGGGGETEPAARSRRVFTDGGDALLPSEVQMKGGAREAQKVSTAVSSSRLSQPSAVSLIIGAAERSPGRRYGVISVTGRIQ
ncbi:hypothetical protein EYF80_067307 [Liparis tanakae]|uniref:Secreted protein n=1 Tax=Liparis tanakae TaxID=230148 RepID=A0A4Z2E1E7_9TELE|nr:hypothetical protein EYF80_067307 [Liparis tanakae]